MAERAGRPLLGTLLACALLALLCAVAFPLAPVTQPTVDFSWPQPGSPAVTALPLMPYQPVALTATASCAAIRATPPGATVLATSPPWVPDGATGGLRLRSAAGALAVTSNGTPLATLALPPGPCTVVVDSTPARTTVALEGRVVGDLGSDVRPVVAAVATGAPSTAGLTLGLRTDTRFQTTPSALKWVLGAGVLLGVAGVVVCAVVADRRGRPRHRGCRRPRPRIVDAVVVAGLAGWAVIGPATVDDGYIAGIVRGRGENGFVGNVYRWLNAPEAPFSWFYDVDRAWAALHPGPAASVLWLRVPATVLGVLTWALLRRHVLPRLGPALARPSATWTAALVFALWWLPFGLSLRPEPWVALGVLAVWAATERAVATGRSLPLVVAAGVGGLTVALTPGALGGLVPLLVALPALARRTRAAGAVGAVGAVGAGRPTLPVAARLATVVAAACLAVLVMAGDQSLGGLREAARVRALIGGGVPWYEELTRYTTLLTPGDVQGSLAARLPVLLLLVALGAVTWSVVVRRVRLGVAPEPTVRLLATVAISLVLLTLSPTKWTLHFGGLAGIGTAAVTLLVVTWGPRGVRALRTRGSGPAPVVVLGAVLLAGALVLVGRNQWAYASDWDVAFSGGFPEVAGFAPSTIVLGGGLVAVVALAVGLAVAPPGRSLPRPLAALTAPGTAVVVLGLAVALLVASSFVAQTVERRGSFAYGPDALAALGGDPCGLPRRLAVETDPAAGLLSPVPAGGPAGGLALDGFVPGPGPVPLAVAGATLPGWTAPPAGPGAPVRALRTGWYTLGDPVARAGQPVVVTVSGTTGARGSAVLEFSDGLPGPDAGPRTTATTSPAGDTSGTAPRDLRAGIPDGAVLVRVRATSTARNGAAVTDASAPAAAGRTGPAGSEPDVGLAVSVPRIPRTVPFDDVVPPGTTVLADWPVALAAGCLRPPALTGGTAELPAWRLTPPGLSDAGEIAVAPATGGPFLTARQLVDEVRVPVYLDGDPTRDPLGLARWVPVAPLGTLTPQVGARTDAGWARDGRATVPGLDPAGAPDGAAGGAP